MAPLLIIGPTYLDVVSRSRGAAPGGVRGEIEMSLGGVAYRTAYVAARLGMRCRFVPIMRSSPFVDLVRDSLEERGVEVNPVADDTLSLGGYCAHVGELGNTIVSTAARVTPAAGLDARLLDGEVKRASAVIADFGMGRRVLRDLTRRANEAGIPLFLTGRFGEDQLADIGSLDPPDAICLTRSSYRRLLNALDGDADEQDGWDIAERFNTTFLVFDPAGDRLSTLSASEVAHTPLRGLGPRSAHPPYFPPCFLLRLIAEMEHTPYFDLAVPRVIDHLLALEGDTADMTLRPEPIEHIIDRIHKAAQTDALSSALNRRGIENALRSPVLSGFARRGELAVMLVDIDFFKSVNDSYGHPVGDRVIRWVVDQLRLVLRESDLVGRWGGEEFIGVLPGVAPEQAAEIGERVRAHIEEKSRAALPRGITVSIGVAQACAAGNWREASIARADAALYAAKRSGRNRVVVAAGPGGVTRSRMD